MLKRNELILSIGIIITSRLILKYFLKLIQGVHCDMLESKRIFWAEKLFSQA